MLRTDVGRRASPPSSRVPPSRLRRASPGSGARGTPRGWASRAATWAGLGRRRCSKQGSGEHLRSIGGRDGSEDRRPVRGACSPVHDRGPRRLDVASGPRPDDTVAVGGPRLRIVRRGRPHVSAFAPLRTGQMALALRAKDRLRRLDKKAAEHGRLVARRGRRSALISATDGPDRQATTGPASSSQPWAGTPTGA